jgi:carboxyl-terminal processing protease
MLAAQTTPTEQNMNFARQLHILNRVLANLDMYYVDTLDIKKVVDQGLQYMLYNLDPYTQYIPEEESEEFLEQKSGTYAGIGSPIGFHAEQNRCFFSNPFFVLSCYRVPQITEEV